MCCYKTKKNKHKHRHTDTTPCDTGRASLVEPALGWWPFAGLDDILTLWCRRLAVSWWLSALCRWSEGATGDTSQLVTSTPWPTKTIWNHPPLQSHPLYLLSTCRRWEGCPKLQVWSPPWRWEVWRSYTAGTCSRPGRSCCLSPAEYLGHFVHTKEQRVWQYSGSDSRKRTCDDFQRVRLRESSRGVHLFSSSCWMVRYAHRRSEKLSKM